MPTRPFLISRADADRATGYGHLVRSHALAQAWQAEGGDALLLTAATDLPSEIARGSIPVAHVGAAYPDPSDLEAVRSSIGTRAGCWLACDGYHFDGAYAEAVMRLGARTLFIVDGPGRAPPRADAVLDQTIGAAPESYPLVGLGRLLLGPRYALLRPAFGMRASPRRVHDEARVLVLTGASDPTALAPRIVQALRSITESQLRVKVVVGAGSPHEAAVRREAARDPGGRFTVLRDPPDMAALMRDADLAVSGGGTTCWELCAMGVAMILITVADNQLPVTTGLARAGAALHLGPESEVTRTRIAVAVRELLRDSGRRGELSRRACSVTDGRGASRVARTLRGEPEDPL